MPINLCFVAPTTYYHALTSAGSGSNDDLIVEIQLTYWLWQNYNMTLQATCVATDNPPTDFSTLNDTIIFAYGTNSTSTVFNNAFLEVVISSCWDGATGLVGCAQNTMWYINCLVYGSDYYAYESLPLYMGVITVDTTPSPTPAPTPFPTPSPTTPSPTPHPTPSPTHSPTPAPTPGTDLNRLELVTYVYLSVCMYECFHEYTYVWVYKYACIYAYVCK